MSDVRTWWQKLLGRCPRTGLRHNWVGRRAAGTHDCEAMSYCHHYRLLCECGVERLAGYAVEEVR